MSRLSRPRRTRLYDASYNIGENYYKSALNDLDRKRYGRSVEPSIAAPAKPMYFSSDSTLDDNLSAARARAHRAITEEPYFDSKGSRVPRTITFGDDELDEDVQSSLSRIRANRTKMSSLINDLDLDDSFGKIHRRSNINLGEKLLGIAGEDDVGTSIRSRALNMVSRGEDLDHEFEPGFKARTRKFVSKLVDDEPSSSAVRASSVLSSFKRTTISSNMDESVDASAASMRARATKARLADLETDMFERSEKQLEREKRSANLKKILADNDIPEIKSLKKVTF